MKRVSPYLKMKVLGAIEYAQGDSIAARIRDVSTRVFKDEEGHPFQFTHRTIQTWYSRYKKHGITEMMPKPRSDRGKCRKVEPERLLEAIEAVKPAFRHRNPNMTEIYRACLEQGLLRRDQVAPNTFRRLVKHYELLKPDPEVANKRRLAFAKAHANEMWQVDTMVGPYVKHKRRPVQARLIAFVDDASRICAHGEFFLHDNTDTLLLALKRALYKRGVPQAMYADNGSNYSSKEFSLVCARLGCVLCHTPVRDGAAKGKVERFFRTVRQRFLSRQLDLGSLETLNTAFQKWVEQEYNQREHSVLGMSPVDRFGLDRAQIRFLPPNEGNDELFYMEDSRSVAADNTFRLRNIRWEVPCELAGRKIQVRYDRKNFGRVIVYYKGERIGEAWQLDPVLNDRPKKEVQS